VERERQPCQGYFLLLEINKKYKGIEIKADWPDAALAVSKKMYTREWIK